MTDDGRLDQSKNTPDVFIHDDAYTSDTPVIGTRQSATLTTLPDGYVLPANDHSSLMFRDAFMSAPAPATLTLMLDDKSVDVKRPADQSLGAMRREISNALGKLGVRKTLSARFGTVANYLPGVSIDVDEREALNRGVKAVLKIGASNAYPQGGYASAHFRSAGQMDLTPENWVRDAASTRTGRNVVPSNYHLFLQKIGF